MELNLYGQEFSFNLSFLYSISSIRLDKLRKRDTRKILIGAAISKSNQLMIILAYFVLVLASSYFPTAYE
jgi:hypothetical protein